MHGSLDETPSDGIIETQKLILLKKHRYLFNKAYFVEKDNSFLDS